MDEKTNIRDLILPVPRRYSFCQVIDPLKMRIDQTPRNNMSTQRTLETITPHVECSSCTVNAEISCPIVRNDALVITTYFLFGDNDSDPIHLQNYFNSLQLLGVNQTAHARLFYGRSPAELETKIRRWASR